ncbi:MAG: helix-turn-helix domain-containing protein [Bradymonadaceae bacterium]
MKMLKTKEVTEILGVTRQTLYRWRKKGVGPPCKKVQGTVRYPENDFWEWASETDRDVDDARRSA